ncbi:hypothetical protein D3C72_2214310 [compost metagenome]
MPPLALISWIRMSAASRAGTPNTEADPDRKVEMPMFSSLGLSAATASEASPDSRVAPSRAANLEVFMVLSPVL